MKKIIVLLVLITSALCAQSSSGVSFEDSTSRTTEIATKYFQYYMAKDFDSLEELMHPDISFEDPTARFIFSGSQFRGKESVLRHFREAYSPVDFAEPEMLRTMFSANTGVFELTLTWSFTNSKGKYISIKTPLVVVLSLSGGTVVEHRDYGDYRTFREQYARQKE